MLDIKAIARMRESAPFLGYDFLTWLFCKVQAKTLSPLLQEIALRFGLGSLELHLGKRINSCLFDRPDYKTSVHNPTMEESREVIQSLLNGHVIESLSLEVYFSANLVSVVLNARDSSFSQLKIQADYEKNSLDDGLEEKDALHEDIFLRLSMVQALENVYDALFLEFFRLRAEASRFKEEEEALRLKLLTELEALEPSTGLSLRATAA
jgi:hypothetical protein